MNKKYFVIPAVVAAIVVFYFIAQSGKATETEPSSDTRRIVEELENATTQEVTGVVYQGFIEINENGKKTKIYDDQDMFYVSIAPYIEYTHAWTLHNLAGCQAELKNTNFQVVLKNNETGEILFDGIKSTYNNGFMGFWLPRDADYTIELETQGKSGIFQFSTDAFSPTCLTEYQLQ